MTDTVYEKIKVNPDEYNHQFWKHNYVVELGIYGNSFLVNADNETDALDYVMDYCEAHCPGFVMSIEEETGLEYPEEYITAGNHGRMFSCPSWEMAISKA